MNVDYPHEYFGNVCSGFGGQLVCMVCNKLKDNPIHTLSLTSDHTPLAERVAALADELAVLDAPQGTLWRSVVVDRLRDLLAQPAPAPTTEVGWHCPATGPHASHDWRVSPECSKRCVGAAVDAALAGRESVVEVEALLRKHRWSVPLIRCRCGWECLNVLDRQDQHEAHIADALAQHTAAAVDAALVGQRDRLAQAIDAERNNPARGWSGNGHDDFSRGLFEGFRQGFAASSVVVRELREEQS